MSLGRARRFMLPTAVVLGLLVGIAEPEPRWLRYVAAALWGTTFLTFSWWLAHVSRIGRISVKSFDIARHFWVISGIACYGSLYAATHDYPVPGYIWLTVAVLSSLVIRLWLHLPNDHDDVTSVD